VDLAASHTPELWPGGEDDALPRKGFPAYLATVLARYYGALFAVYLLMLVLLPAGSLYGVNVKIGWFVLLFPSAVAVFLRQSDVSGSHIAAFLGIPAVLLAWVLVGQVYGFDIRLGLQEFKDVAVTLVSCWFAAIYCDNKPRRFIDLLRMILWAELTASALKIGILVYCFATGTSVLDMLGRLQSITGTGLIGLDFEFLGRIQFLSDGLIPLLIFAVVAHRKALRIPVVPGIVYVILMAISLLFSFSRFFWGMSAFSLALALLVGRWGRFQWLLLLLIGLATLPMLPYLTDVATLRFSADVAGGSDAPRAEQLTALDDFIADAPWIGHGFGSYTRALIRSTDAPYSYEIQLVALVGQLGIVGVTLLAILGCFFFREMWPRSVSQLRAKGAVFLLLLAWLSAGLFNPLLISSTASVSYALLMALLYLPDEPAPALGLRRAAVEA
jgi:hypothetical protein